MSLSKISSKMRIIPQVDSNGLTFEVMLTDVFDLLFPPYLLLAPSMGKHQKQICTRNTNVQVLGVVIDVMILLFENYFSFYCD